MAAVPKFSSAMDIHNKIPQQKPRHQALGQGMQVRQETLSLQGHILVINAFQYSVQHFRKCSGSPMPWHLKTQRGPTTVPICHPMSLYMETQRMGH